jgi:uncharacterized protein YoxC
MSHTSELLLAIALVVLFVVVIPILLAFISPKKNIDIRQTDTLKRIHKAVNRTTTPPTENTTDPLSILREDSYTNDDINRMTGEMHRRQYAESNN